MDSIDNLFDVICRETGVTREQITGKSRKSKIVDFRCMAAHILYPQLTYIREIGEILNRDRLTIYYYLKQHENRMQFDKKYKAMFNEITSRSST